MTLESPTRDAERRWDPSCAGVGLAAYTAWAVTGLEVRALAAFRHQSSIGTVSDACVWAKLHYIHFNLPSISRRFSGTFIQIYFSP